jgi:hypothetical protein
MNLKAFSRKDGLPSGSTSENCAGLPMTDDLSSAANETRKFLISVQHKDFIRTRTRTGKKNKLESIHLTTK